MEEIVRFVMFAQSDRFTVTELCKQFGISRKTGCKHLERYAAAGLEETAKRRSQKHGGLRACKSQESPNTVQDGQVADNPQGAEPTSGGEQKVEGNGHRKGDTTDGPVARPDPRAKK
jgi:hypothetical protein